MSSLAALCFPPCSFISYFFINVSALFTESQMQDESRNLESEKELERRIRKRDGSSDKDKRQEDVRTSEDRRLSSKDDRLKNGRCKDERHKDSKYRDKYQEDVDKGQRYRDDTHREERSIDRTIDRSDKSSESRHKKAKLQGNNHDSSPCFDDQNIGNKENRVRKRSSDELDAHSDLNSQTTKEHRIDVEKSSLTSRKLDSVADRGHSESHHHHSDVVNHSTPSSSTPKCSLSSSAHVVKDQYRYFLHCSPPLFPLLQLDFMGVLLVMQSSWLIVEEVFDTLQ